MAGPILLFPSGTVEPHSGVLEILMVDDVSNLCEVLLAFLCTNLDNIFSSLSLSLAHQRKRFSALAYHCFSRNVPLTDIAFDLSDLGFEKE